MIRVSHVITGLENGGAENVLYRLCKATSDVSHSVISLMDYGKYGTVLEDAGVSVECLNMPRGRVTLAGLLHLWTLLRDQQPDVIQTWMYHADLLGGLVGRLAGRQPVVWNIRHSELELGKSRSSTVLVARLCARLSRVIPHRIIVCAEHAARIHAEMGYDGARMVVVGNGYDVEEFRPDSSGRARIRSELGVAQEERLLGFVARFHAQKDHDTLLAALSHLTAQGRPMKLVLIGPDMVRSNAELAELISRHAVEDYVLPIGIRADIPAIMTALDLHVMSSAGEGFPNVLAEAMACGTPCVSTDVGDARVIVGDTGWIVPPRNPQALADGIGAALDAMGDESRCRELQKAARRRVKRNFCVSRMAESYESIWHECLGRRA